MTCGAWLFLIIVVSLIMLMLGSVNNQKARGPALLPYQGIGTNIRLRYMYTDNPRQMFFIEKTQTLLSATLMAGDR